MNDLYFGTFISATKSHQTELPKCSGAIVVVVYANQMFYWTAKLCRHCRYNHKPYEILTRPDIIYYNTPWDVDANELPLTNGKHEKRKHYSYSYSWTSLNMSGGGGPGMVMSKVSWIVVTRNPPWTDRHTWLLTSPSHNFACGRQYKFRLRIPRCVWTHSPASWSLCNG